MLYGSYCLPNKEIAKFGVIRHISGKQHMVGTKKGITAIQMDVKVEGITEEILKNTLSQGKKARLQILE